MPLARNAGPVECYPISKGDISSSRRETSSTTLLLRMLRPRMYELGCWWCSIVDHIRIPNASWPNWSGSAAICIVLHTLLRDTVYDPRLMGLSLLTTSTMLQNNHVEEKDWERRTSNAAGSFKQRREAEIHVIAELGLTEVGLDDWEQHVSSVT